jgi:hypothetical protein
LSCAYTARAAVAPVIAGDEISPSPKTIAPVDASHACDV